MPDESSSNDDLFVQFQTIVLSVLVRYYRQRAADAALFRLMAAHYAFQIEDASDRLCGQEACEGVFLNHRRIQSEGFVGLDIAYSQSTVIAAISVFDGFLSDVTRFLLLMRPNIVSKDRQVKFGEILACADLSEVVNAVINKYVHELSYKSLTDRILYLGQTFGIDVSTISEAITKLQSFAEFRNRLVHDTSEFQYQATPERGQIRVIAKDNSPDVRWEVAEGTLDTCIAVTDHIFVETCRQVFRRDPSIRLSRQIVGAQ